ncbi:MAG TPA: family 65 glycosyl hydrolase domain-containing protein [Saprospiraceae bacterium]|nr:family 65 glycosyl hydrolase domain-containing protein [Saprospiraceae bacterium]
MKQYFSPDPWKIVEDGFHPEYHRVSESVFSLGNGRMGQRGNFEEHYSGDRMQGNYFAGIYYPDKTRVGWWKIGYPEYFAKVLNAVEWPGVDIYLDGERLDLAKTPVQNFRRILDMQSGLLQRSFIMQTTRGSIEFQYERFCSMAAPDIGAVRIRIKSIDFTGHLRVSSYLNGDVRNEDANWEEKFWEQLSADASTEFISVSAVTRKTGFVVHSTAAYAVHDIELTSVVFSSREGYAEQVLTWSIEPGQEQVFDKIVVHHSSLYYPVDTLDQSAKQVLQDALVQGYDKLRTVHVANWQEKWKSADIEIKGDVSAQQAVRFCIFQLLQTYTGDDPRLNIGPKGFTGEKYGGSTYWDTEAYCLPFYLGTCPGKVGHQLLVYRYHHLQKAIENAGKLGFTGGAALYPMVTMNGEECHNEWEITFEEIHRNGAIAYAIYDYIRYTSDDSYLLEGGLEVLIGISRFWSQRVNWSAPKQKFVMLGVTGPNEYENNVDNNWYTNYIARWCLKYTLECIESCKTSDRSATTALLNRIAFDLSETERWNEIIAQIHLPEDSVLGIFLQQDNYLEKEQLTADQIPKGQRPINQHWSWDRILRSCFIKQADVLQGMYFFEEDFDRESLARNFTFYESRTVHESSLSPCVHSILASALDIPEKAYEMYLRTGRLDLDNYNNDTDDGLHITSMAGAWLAIVKGFAGMRVRDHKLSFRPRLPRQWTGLTFHLSFRDNILSVELQPSQTIVMNASGPAVNVYVEDVEIHLQPNARHAVPFAKTL